MSPLAEDFSSFAFYVPIMAQTKRALVAAGGHLLPGSAVNTSRESALTKCQSFVRTTFGADYPVYLAGQAVSGDAHRWIHACPLPEKATPTSKSPAGLEWMSFKELKQCSVWPYVLAAHLRLAEYHSVTPKADGLMTTGAMSHRATLHSPCASRRSWSEQCASAHTATEILQRTLMRAATARMQTPGRICCHGTARSTPLILTLSHMSCGLKFQCAEASLRQLSHSRTHLQRRSGCPESLHNEG